MAVKAEEAIDFNLDASRYNKDGRGWFRSIFTKTLIPFHGALLSVVVLVTVGLFFRYALGLMDCQSD